MWGRSTGLAIMLPAAFFWARSWLSPALKKRVGAYSVLVVLQVRVVSTLSPSLFIFLPPLFPHRLFWCVVCVLSTAGALWLVHGEEWAAGETTVWDSTRDTGGGPGQPVSISGTPQPCPVALLLNVVHCSRPSLPSNHRCESQCICCFICLLVVLFVVFLLPSLMWLR